MKINRNKEIRYQKMDIPIPHKWIEMKKVKIMIR